MSLQVDVCERLKIKNARPSSAPKRTFTARYLRDFKIAAHGLGCMVKVCGGNEKNDLRRCPDVDGSCGNFHTER